MGFYNLSLYSKCNQNMAGLAIPIAEEGAELMGPRLEKMAVRVGPQIAHSMMKSKHVKHLANKMFGHSKNKKSPKHYFNKAKKVASKALHVAKNIAPVASELASIAGVDPETINMVNQGLGMASDFEQDPRGSVMKAAASPELYHSINDQLSNMSSKSSGVPTLGGLR